MNKTIRNIVFTMAAAVMALLILSYITTNSGLSLTAKGPTAYDYTAFTQAIREGKIKNADWYNDSISGELNELNEDSKSQKRYTAKVFPMDSPLASPLLDQLQTAGVKVSRADPPISPILLQLLSWTVPVLIMVGLFYFFLYRPAQQGGSQAMNFGRSRARRASEMNVKVTFDDVAGIEEAKQELFEIVDFLRNTKKYVALGAKIPKGILLTGPPGVGKTHLARAIAGEAGVPFFHISGSDFVEMFVGVGAARVRDLFETAKAHRPCLIFVDEIDAVGRQRGAGMGGGHDEREQTLNQLLVEMDGFDPNMGVILIAATNRPDVLDPALLRPGRFDRQIVVDPPDAKGREQILNIHAKGKPFAPDVELNTIAKRTPGFTGADLANALNESALLAARRNKTKITMDELEESLDRVMVGPARTSRIMDAKEREVTAYHEAGHAVVGELLPNCDPVHKVTILPRGMALGLTWSLPDVEKHLSSRSELLDDLAASLGGLVAEEVVFGERWTGASSDLERVTRIARAMVCQFGMSDRLGTLALGRRNRNPFLGRDGFEDRDYSEDVAKLVDEEVRHIVDEQHRRATELLTENREAMDRIVHGLMTRETLNRDEFLILLRGDELPEENPDDPSSGAPAVEVFPTAPDEEKAPGVIVKPPRFEPGTAGT